MKIFDDADHRSLDFFTQGHGDFLPHRAGHPHGPDRGFVDDPRVADIARKVPGKKSALGHLQSQGSEIILIHPIDAHVKNLVGPFSRPFGGG